MTSDQKVAERFWAKVEKTPGCWEWRGYRNRRTRTQLDYGRFKFNGKLALAHRVAYTLTHGPIPPRRVVCHTCDNPGCVRPDHLFLGTMAENNRDKARKGRARTGRARLTPAKVRTIRQRYATEDVSASELAREFGVSKGTITHLLRGRSWPKAGGPIVGRDVPPPDRKPTGERAGHARLTREEVRTIRRMYENGGISQAALGRRFGVSQSQIGRIVKGARWGWLE